MTTRTCKPALKVKKLTLRVLSTEQLGNLAAGGGYTGVHFCIHWPW